jgi:hypothetical protein
VTIVNDASTINVIDDASLALARSVNYDRNTFIIQATGVYVIKFASSSSPNRRPMEQQVFAIFIDYSRQHRIGVKSKSPASLSSLV